MKRGGVGKGIPIFFLPPLGSHLYINHYHEIRVSLERDLLNFVDFFGGTGQEEECDAL